MQALTIQAWPFFQWLLKATLQGSVLVCLILLVKLLLRHRLSVRWHYCLWLILLIRLSLPWSPQSSLSIYGLYQLWPWARPTQSVGPNPSPQHAAGQTRAMATVDGEAAPEPAAQALVDSQPRATTSAPAVPGGSRTYWANVSGVVFMLWLVGVIALGGFVLARSVWLWRAVVSERPVTDQEILDLLEDCKMQMRVRTLVGVVVTDKVHTPALFGFVRPRILLPEGLIETLGLDELHYVFLHELAHLKRRDIYLAWLVCVLQVLHWFNPLMWYAFRRMRADQEIAADSLALTTAGTGESRRYGQTIVNLVERFSRPQYLPSLAGILENPSHIERRIAMITQFKDNSYRWSVAGIGIITVLGVISVIDPTRGAVSTSPAPQAKAPMTMRLVQKQTTGEVSLSPDGRYLCDCDPAGIEEIITIRELATGEQRTITPTKRIPEESRPQYPVMSPDNKTIAYVLHTEEPKAEVRLIGADGSGQRVLSTAPVMPIQWFPDGSRLLGLRWLWPNGAFAEIDIVSVSIPDGSVQILKTLNGEFFRTTIRLSPDARYVAYEVHSKDAPTKHDIFAIEIDSKRETSLVEHPADDRLLGWTPDGRHILFSSDRAGPWGAWVLPVAKGQAQGTPEQVTRDIGDVRAIGFAGNGSYYYRLAYGFGNVYTAAIDVSTGELSSAPAPLETTGSHHGIDWSPDGKYLAYCSTPATAAAGAPGVIRIRSLATGEERELLHKIPTYFRRIRWSPDGRSLLASDLKAFEPDKSEWPGRVCRIDVDTGDSTILLESNASFAELSPDGKTLYYSGGAIVRRQLDTGQEEKIFTGPRGQAGFALSPDGQFIATGHNEGTGKSSWEGGVKKVLLIPAQGGPATELVRWDEPAGVLTNFAWSRDGKTVLFLLHREYVKRGDTQLQQITEFWQVPRDGGQPQRITETDLGVCYDLRVHPDGQRIAFFAAGQRQELWMMENFLPAAAGAKHSK